MSTEYILSSEDLLEAGVDESNTPSIKLLKKLAFEKQASKENGMLFYELNLNQGIQ